MVQFLGSIIEFTFGFFIVAPSLDNYRYQLFSVSHEVGLYPLKMEPDEDIMRELGEDEYTKEIKINSEEEFINTIEKILAAKKTKRVITVLKSMTGYKDYDYDDSANSIEPDEIPF